MFIRFSDPSQVACSVIRILYTSIITALSVIAAVLVPASSVGAASGESFEEESPIVADTATVPGGLGGDGSTVPANTDATPSEEPSAIGQLLVDDGGGGIVATEYQGNRVTVSTKPGTALSWADLKGDELVATRALVGDDSVNGKRAASSEMGINYVTLVSDDGFSVLIEVASVNSGSEFAFDIGLPDGASLILTDEGSVDVLGDDRYTIGSFESPWALDVNGNNVATRFEVAGNTITQIIETDESTAYPVVADPRFTWGWVTGTVYFDKWETVTLCSASQNTLYTLAILPFWWPIILAVAATLFVISCTARLLDKCVKVKSTLVVSHYSGGYCTW